MKEPTSKKTLVIAGFLLLVGIVAITNRPSSPQQAPDVAPKQVQNPELEKKRGEFVQKLVDQRILSKVECSPNVAGVGHVWIPASSSFWPGNYDDKIAVLSAVYAWCFGDTDKTGILNLRNTATGKEVGEFSANGLELE